MLGAPLRASVANLRGSPQSRAILPKSRARLPRALADRCQISHMALSPSPGSPLGERCKEAPASVIRIVSIPVLFEMRGVITFLFNPSTHQGLIRQVGGDGSARTGLQHMSGVREQYDSASDAKARWHDRGADTLRVADEIRRLEGKVK